MENGEDRVQMETGTELGRILNKDFFFYLLDIEVKRARRYQNFLCLILLKLSQLPMNDNGDSLPSCYQELSHLLINEMRETDILGSLGKDKLVALLPYADEKAGGHAKSRLENTLKYYNFTGKGYEVIINQVNFPMNGTNIAEIIKKALGPETI
ncbi:MAG: diguanylate cyclase [Thermodesulfobacteriota bacterium]|nr:diguanylate cyclase [Thermodesulfobacteriota bacterium]